MCSYCSIPVAVVRSVSALIKVMTFSPCPKIALITMAGEGASSRVAHEGIPVFAGKCFSV